MKKSFAFTLGEILIALGVIGVVASLTLPQVINGKKATEARAQFTTAYSMIAQAIDAIETDDISIKPETYMATRDSFYPVAKPYFKVVQECGSQRNSGETSKHNACPTRYLAFNEFGKSTGHVSSMLSGIDSVNPSSFVTNNGMWVAFTNRGGTANNAHNQVYITVDINGVNKLPNRYGWDIFSFQLTKDGILPAGAPGTALANSLNRYCDEASSLLMNGWTCAAKAVANPDYFKTLYKGH